MKKNDFIPGDVFDTTFRGLPPIKGQFYPRTGKSTQIYPDGYHHTTEGGEGHWINDNKAKGSPGRVKPPPDARS